MSPAESRYRRRERSDEGRYRRPARRSHSSHASRKTEPKTSSIQEKLLKLAQGGGGGDHSERSLQGSKGFTEASLPDDSKNANRIPLSRDRFNRADKDDQNSNKFSQCRNRNRSDSRDRDRRRRSSSPSERKTVFKASLSRGSRSRSRGDKRRRSRSNGGSLQEKLLRMWWHKLCYLDYIKLNLGS